MTLAVVSTGCLTLDCQIRTSITTHVKCMTELLVFCAALGNKWMIDV